MRFSREEIQLVPRYCPCLLRECLCPPICQLRLCTAAQSEEEMGSGSGSVASRRPAISPKRYDGCSRRALATQWPPMWKRFHHRHRRLTVGATGTPTKPPRRSGWFRHQCHSQHFHGRQVACPPCPSLRQAQRPPQDPWNTLVERESVGRSLRRGKRRECQCTRMGWPTGAALRAFVQCVAVWPHVIFSCLFAAMSL